MARKPRRGRPENGEFYEQLAFLEDAARKLGQRVSRKQLERMMRRR